jgi:hypothetical protein
LGRGRRGKATREAKQDSDGNLGTTVAKDATLTMVITKGDVRSTWWGEEGGRNKIT